ncbi:hypothetical protein ElyMa_002034900, partial [Elysia marginata]
IRNIRMNIKKQCCETTAVPPKYTTEAPMGSFCPHCSSPKEKGFTEHEALMNEPLLRFGSDTAQQEQLCAEAIVPRYCSSSCDCAVTQKCQRWDHFNVYPLPTNDKCVINCLDISPDSWNRWNILPYGPSYVLIRTQPHFVLFTFLPTPTMPFGCSLRFDTPPYLSMFHRSSSVYSDHHVLNYLTSSLPNAGDIPHDYSHFNGYAANSLHNDNDIPSRGSEWPAQNSTFSSAPIGQALDNLSTRCFTVPSMSSTVRPHLKPPVGVSTTEASNKCRPRKNNGRLSDIRLPKSAGSNATHSKSSPPTFNPTPSLCVNFSVFFYFLLSVLFFLTPLASTQRAGRPDRVEVRLAAIIPSHFGLKSVFVRQITKSQITFVRFNSQRSRNARVRFDLRVAPSEDIRFVQSDSPREILNIFCKTVLGRNVVTILNVNNPLGMQRRSTGNNYILEMASYLGIPVISWDTQFTSASAVSVHIGDFFACKKIILDCVFFVTSGSISVALVWSFGYSFNNVLAIE